MEHYNIKLNYINSKLELFLRIQEWVNFRKSVCVIHYSNELTEKNMNIFIIATKVLDKIQYSILRGKNSLQAKE